VAMTTADPHPPAAHPAPLARVHPAPLRPAACDDLVTTGSSADAVFLQCGTTPRQDSHHP
jgi:hypothetical protein